MTETLSSPALVDLAEAPVITAAGPRATAYENPFIRVDTTPVTFPNGALGNYSTVTIGTGAGVVIVPTATGVHGHPGVSYGLVRTFRFPLGSALLEFPRGGADAGEGAAAAAVREAVEEMGPAWAGARLRRLGVIRPDSGILTTEVTIYAAHLEEPVATDHVEDVTGAAQIWVPAEEVPALVRAGRITDAMTLSALALAVCAR